MSTKARSSFGSRLTEGTKMCQILGTFTDYDPGDPELTRESLLADTVELTQIQKSHTEKHFEYSQAASIRKKSFIKEDNSIAKLLSPIGSYLKGRSGKDSSQYRAVNELIKKIRGARKIKVDENSTEDTISRCEKSYGSQLIYFADIITLLIQFGTDYNPANAAIKIAALQIVLDQATSATETVTLKLAAYKPLIAARIEGYKNMSEKALSIKNMVKSQYTLESTQFELIKGLLI